MSLPLGTVEYHVKWLVDNEAISVRDSGGYTRYYPVGKMGGLDRHLLGLLRQEIPRRILIFLLRRPRATFKDIVEQADTGVGPSTVSFHMNKLVTGGVVQRTKKGRISSFLVMAPDAAAKVIIAHRRSFLDNLVDQFVSSWIDIGPPPEGGDSGDQQGGQSRKSEGRSGDDGSSDDLLVWTPTLRLGPFVYVGAAIVRLWAPTVSVERDDPWALSVVPSARAGGSFAASC